MQIMVAAINALSLTGLTSGAVLQEVATYLDPGTGNTPPAMPCALPFVSVSPYGPEGTGDELNDVDGHYYGTLVAIIGKPSIETLEQRLSWRQTIWRNFNNTTVGKLITTFSLSNANLPGNYNLKVSPGPVVELKAWFARNLFVSSLVVKAQFQEVRS